MRFNIDDTYNRVLVGDPVAENRVRQVFGAAWSAVEPRRPSAPELLHASPEMLSAVGLSESDAGTNAFNDVFSGKSVYPGTRPYSMCYGGHQFGNWAGQLGDGRAINLFEVVHEGNRWALQLKGAGKTPYSRGADGLAVLRSSVREYLCSEAMHHLGVPTTRALSLSLTGDDVMRDMLYDGNAALEKGAVVCRAAPTFIRFGNFQIFMAREDIPNLTALTDYTVRTFFPHLGEPSPDVYIELFREVAERTLALMVEWERVGFVHGVMNTDNMSILGLTIDYGPYGWLENYDPDWTPNTTDAAGRRYRFGNQAAVGVWNLMQLGNALFPLIGDAAPLEDILEKYQREYMPRHQRMISDKLGLTNEADSTFAAGLERLMIESETDMTLFFRRLATFDENAPPEFLPAVAASSYRVDFPKIEGKWIGFLHDYAELLIAERSDPAARASAMNRVNPKYVLRNYMAQIAIDAADEGDYSLVSELFDLLRRPYDEQPGSEKWFALRPDWAKSRVGCSMLSCSS